MIEMTGFNAALSGAVLGAGLGCAPCSCSCPTCSSCSICVNCICACTPENKQNSFENVRNQNTLNTSVANRDTGAFNAARVAK
jgi:hypothetical protein